MWNKSRNIMRSVTNNSKNYNKNYLKTKFNLNDDLPLKKTLELCKMKMFIRAIFHECHKHYPQVSLDECLYKL